MSDTRSIPASVRIAEAGVRCVNPKCRAKLAERLTGTLIVICRKCGTKQTIKT